jgi:hypothetical protein
MRVLVACAALLLAAAPHATVGRSPQEPRPCCMAMTAQCLACAKGITPHEYCQKHPETAGCKKQPLPPPPPPPPTRRISYWSGKVNQHFVDGAWETDPDGTSGANIRKLTYCRKWWPDTDSVKKLDSKEKITFYTAGNKVPHVSTKDVFECVQKPPLPPLPPSSGDWCYDAAGTSHSRCERLIATGRCEWFVFDTAGQKNTEYECNRATNFISDHAYEQKYFCGNVETVLKDCQAECDSREDCTAFFYQEHRNNRGCHASPHGGYQICGFYNGKIDRSKAVKHGHHDESQVCYNKKGGDAPTGKCIDVEDKFVAVNTDDDCAAFCEKKGFGCLDYRTGANQMLSCAQACHMRVKLAQTQDQCAGKCDRHGSSGCSLKVNGQVLSMCGRCEKHVFQKGDGNMCNFGVCSADACKTGCSVTTAEEATPEEPSVEHCRDDNERANAVCKGSCTELARNCGQELSCGGSWLGDVAVFCPQTCRQCDNKEKEPEPEPEPEPCMMVDCRPGFDLVGTDTRGCGGKCVHKKHRGEDEDEPTDVPTVGCCEAMTANCLACGLGLTEEEYCLKHPGKFGCTTSSAADAAGNSVTSTTTFAGSKKGNGNQELNDEPNGNAGPGDKESRCPPPTMCPPEKKGALTAEFVLASLTSYLCGALSLWLFLKCSRKSIPTAPAASVVGTMYPNSITIIPVARPQDADLGRAAVRAARIPKPMFPPPPPPPRSARKKRPAKKNSSSVYSPEMGGY